jgi:hypothetical protein
MILGGEGKSRAFRRIRFCRNSEIASLFILTGIFSVAGTDVAHAYLDPGVGSMLAQILLGGAAGAAVLFKLYWGKLLTVFGICRQRQDGQTIIGQPSSSEPVEK